MLVLRDQLMSVNAHGEEMRQYFVAHEGQEALRVAHCDDTSSLVQEFVRLIGEHVSVIKYGAHESFHR